MRVMSCMLLFAVVCTTFTGCSLFKKNTNPSTGPAGVGVAPPKFPGAQDPILNSNITPPPQFPNNPAPNPGPQGAIPGKTTILAGTVTDAFHRPVGNAYVRLVSTDPKEDATGKPIDVAADARGHFIIQGVKIGQSYKLIARTKVGEKMLAGTLLTDAPNTRALIQIREDLVNSTTPPLPTGPAYQPEPAGGVSKNTQDTTKGGWKLGQFFNKETPKTPGNEPNLPTTLNVPAPPTTTSGDPKFIPNIAEVAKDGPPVLKMPNKPSPTTAPIDPIFPTPIAPSKDFAAARVPSCVLVGNHLENLALKDSKGQTWEYRKNAAGKLVLLDFWYLACMPCRETMPALNKLHQQYSSRGLEVVGVFGYSTEKSDERKETDAVNKFCSSTQISYRQLVGRTGSFDAARQFKVAGYPTMMLLDERGDIIWHHVGAPDAGVLGSLERLIQSRLNRPF